MSTKKIKILLIEDNPGDVRLIREMMSEATDVIHTIECTGRLDEGLKRLLEGGIDAVLLDLGLPDSQGLNTFIKVYRRVPEIPIIVLTSLDDKKLGLNAVRRGAQDYLIKGPVDGNLLSRTVCYAIERKLAEEQIKAALKEKDLLLQEVHHRVKNNMQIIYSLLRLQSSLTKDEKALEIFDKIKNRVKSMALIHEKLYRSKNFARVDFADYIQSLTNHLFIAFGIEPKAIRLNVNVKDIFLDINTAIPCGLIINELISNSLKHAFLDVKKGEIKIAMHPLNENEIELIVSDNGVGLPKDVDFRNTKSLGLHLVNILARDQLHSEIKLDRMKGARFKMRLKMKN
jgi:two-component sensor histidine kinase